jgi:hypothetical protein
MIAQRVSAGFRPPLNTQPREGRQNPCPRRTPYPTPSLENAPEHESHKPYSCSRILAQRGRAAEIDRKSEAGAPLIGLTAG